MHGITRSTDRPCRSAAVAAIDSLSLLSKTSRTRVASTMIPARASTTLPWRQCLKRRSTNHDGSYVLCISFEAWSTRFACSSGWAVAFARGALYSRPLFNIFIVRAGQVICGLWRSGKLWSERLPQSANASRSEMGRRAARASNVTVAAVVAWTLTHRIGSTSPTTSALAHTAVAPRAIAPRAESAIAFVASRVAASESRRPPRRPPRHFLPQTCVPMRHGASCCRRARPSPTCG